MKLIMKKFFRTLLYFLVFSAACFILAIIAGCVWVVHWAEDTYDKLPDLAPLVDYRPKIPMRIYTADGSLIGEFGEERRNFTPLKDFSPYMISAILAAEDERFYDHGGLDYQGIIRAAIHNVKGGAKQGASTITQQVARNLFLSRDQTYIRKANEALLALKIEHAMTKNQILEVYMNHIFLGQRSYGFSAAAQIYFGKSPKEITIAQAAMLAGLPKAPSMYNPVANPKRSRERQLYVLQRMHHLGRINDEQYKQATLEKIVLASSASRPDSMAFPVIAPHVAEMARLFAIDMFKDEAYTKGLQIITTITDQEQTTANAAVRKGALSYDKSHGYRGPESQVALPDDPANMAQAISAAFSDKNDSGNILSAIVLEISPQKIKAKLMNGQDIFIDSQGFAWAKDSITLPVGHPRKITRGSLIRVEEDSGHWKISQIPEVASSFVSMNPQNGEITSLVGGFDFNLNKFNRVIQAWRQPGSSFKPFIYSAALEQGFSPATLVNDSPFIHDMGQGIPPWAPKNYDASYSGPLSIRRALAASKNLVSARIIEAIGPQYAQDYAMRFGFDPLKNPPVMALALGAGSVTPWQLAGAYGVFANGGYKVEPHIISKILDNQKKSLFVAETPTAGDESIRIIDARNAFIMDSLLHEVATKGTAAKASIMLKRQDLGGKTGTTNDSFDAWFAGYQSTRVAIAWLGFDQPKSLGSRETGGGLALPIWIDFMSKTLEGVPETKPTIPDGVISIGGEFYFSEFGPGFGITSLGLSDYPAKNPSLPDIDEQDDLLVPDKKILP